MSDDNITVSKEELKDLVETRAKEISIDALEVNSKIDAFGEKIEELGAKFLESEKKFKTKLRLFDSEVTKEEAEQHGKWAETVKFFQMAKSFGDNGLRMKYLNTTDDAAVVPKEFAAEVMKTMDDYSEIRRYARKVSMSRRVMDLNELATKVSVAKTSEGSNITESEPTFSAPVMTVEDYAGLTPMTYQFEQDNEISIIMELVQQYAEQFALAEQESFINSAVSGAQGIMTVSGVTAYDLGGADNSTKDAFTDMTFDDIVKGSAYFKNTVSKSALNRARFFANPDILANLAILKDSQGMPLLPGYLVNGATEASRLGGFGVTELTELPANADSAANTKFAFIADLSRVFLIGDYKNIETKILEEGSLSGLNLARTGGRALRLIKRTAQKVVLANNILMFTTSTT